jgi:hypothetical protein
VFVLCTVALDEDNEVGRTNSPILGKRNVRMLKHVETFVDKDDSGRRHCEAGSSGVNAALMEDDTNDDCIISGMGFTGECK